MQIVIWIITAIALVVSYTIDKNRTRIAFNKAVQSLKIASFGLFGMILVIGLILAIVPQENLVRLFSIEGACGFVLASVVGSLLTIPGPIAFPLAGAFLKLGANPATLASFISTLTMVGIISAPLEISYFGKRFVVMRQAFSFVASIIIGLIVGALL